MNPIELLAKRSSDGTVTLGAVVLGPRERLRRLLRRLRLAAA